MRTPVPAWLQTLRPALIVVVLAATAVVHGAAIDTRLLDAVRSGDAAAVRGLIQKRVPVTIADADGTTALHLAVQRDQLEIVQALLKAGAQVNAATHSTISRRSRHPQGRIARLH